MTKRCFLLTVFAVQAWFAALFAQQPLDLKTALRYSLEHHASIQKANLDIAKGKQLIRENLSSGLPQVNANASILNNLALRTSFVPAEFFGGQPGEFAKVKFGTNWNANAGIGIDQLAFSKTWLLGLRASYAVADFYKLVLEQTKETVAYQVAQLYYEIQLNQTQRGLFDANLAQVKGLFTVTEKQFQNGFAKKIDVDRLMVQRSNLETQILNLDLQIGQLEQALKFAMNMPLETDISLTDTISEATLPEVNTLLAQPLFSQKTDLLVLKKQQELYDLDERRYKAGYFPTLSVFFDYGYDWQANNIGELGNGDFWTKNSAVGLRFNVPIFDGFFKDSKVQTARLNAMQVVQDFNLTLLNLQLQHESAVSTMKVNQNNLRAVQDTRRLAEVVYRVAQSRFKEGIAPITELLDAESSMRQAQSNYITTLAQIKLAEIDLLNANGLLIKMSE